MTSGEKTPVSKIEETKPVAWTPEDASRFLTSAIHEAQRPLADALKQRPITSKALSMIIGVLIAAALAIALILSSQLEKAEKRADIDRASRDAMYSEKTQLEASSVALEDRITAARQQHEVLQGQIAGMRGSEDELRRARGDIQRFRRQNELLRNQIAGLEMEKVALGRQLEAVRALAIEDDSLDELEDMDDMDEDLSTGSLQSVETPNDETAILAGATAVQEPQPQEEETPAAGTGGQEESEYPAESLAATESTDGERTEETQADKNSSETVGADSQDMELSGDTTDDAKTVDVENADDEKTTIILR